MTLQPSSVSSPSWNRVARRLKEFLVRKFPFPAGGTLSARRKPWRLRWPKLAVQTARSLSARQVGRRFVAEGPPVAFMQQKWQVSGNSNHAAAYRRKKKVVIVQATLRHYRLKFFTALQEQLARESIDLKVVYSGPNAQEAQKGDCVELDDQLGVKVRADWLFSNRVIYQHSWRQLADAHMVVVEHASKHLLNYSLFTSRAVSRRKIALWGHGSIPNGTILGDFLRRRTLRLPDWWFAYNDMSLRYLLANGVPREITTNVQNSIDTESLSRAVEEVPAERVGALRAELGIGPEAPVGLFCSSLYSSKHLPTLIAAGTLIRTSVPGFHHIIDGDGPDRTLVQNAAAKHPWIHYVGPRFGDVRAPYFRIADLLLNPGLVGLSILDAFAVGLPVVTTDTPNHSPEIDYLENGYNGVSVPDDILGYANAVTGLLRDHNLLQRLHEGAQRSGRKYTLANMVSNFAAGVTACLEHERSPAHSWKLTPWFRAPDS